MFENTGMSIEIHVLDYHLTGTQQSGSKKLTNYCLDKVPKEFVWRELR